MGIDANSSNNNSWKEEDEETEKITMLPRLNLPRVLKDIKNGKGIKEVERLKG